MHRRVLTGLLATLLLAPLLQPPMAVGQTYRVAIIKSRDLAPYNQALSGLRKALLAWNPSISLQEIDFPQDEPGETAFLQALQKSPPDLIVTIGTQATRSVSRRIANIPVVFSLVLMTGDSEILFRQRPSNVTGAAMDVPIGTQFARMKQVIPELRRVGVIYNPRVTGATIQAARSAASAGGLTLVEIPVTSEAQVVREVEGLKGRVDALWSVADSTVFTPRSVDAILLLTIRDGIPFVGLSPSFVKAGALISFSCDYTDVGTQSGEVAIEVLKGKSPAEIPVVYPRHVSLYLNLNTARAIHLDISSQVRSESEVTFTE
ncbi:MAG TPA: ABC transporter substrate-binding protein [Candidatus Polarisedimenticolia bacterium]|nr:ABC transporter substrate-binding protein [Candidatus Polarisedimenticolia bacterium]